jgi:hypothetical protein
VKEVAGEAFEGRPDLPSKEDGLKRSHSVSSSAAVLAKREGEKGEVVRFREERGTGVSAERRWPPARMPEMGEGGVVGAIM